MLATNSMVLAGVLLGHVGLLALLLNAPLAAPSAIIKPPTLSGVLRAPAVTSSMGLKQLTSEMVTKAPQPVGETQVLKNIPAHANNPSTSADVSQASTTALKPSVPKPIPPKPIVSKKSPRSTSTLTSTSKVAITQAVSASSTSTATLSSLAASSQSALLTPPHHDASQFNHPAPVYPSVSRRLREQGKVLLEVLIQADGTVGDVRLKNGSGFKRLDDAAIKAVKRWRYQPARQGDTAIDYWYLQPIEFSLSN